MGPPGRHLVLEDHTEEFTAEAIGQPGVLDDGHLEALAAERRIVIGVDGPAHTLNDHQVRVTLARDHGQNFVQAAGWDTRQNKSSRVHHSEPALITGGTLTDPSINHFYLLACKTVKNVKNWSLGCILMLTVVSLFEFLHWTVQLSELKDGWCWQFDISSVYT